MVMGKTREEVINATSKLINASKIMRLHVNKGKTNYMIVTRRPSSINSKDYYYKDLIIHLKKLTISNI